VIDAICSHTCNEKDCTAAIKLDPLYIKAYVRRAQSYELLDKLEEALADYKKVVEIDANSSVGREGGKLRCCFPPSIDIYACVRVVKRLEPIVKERQDKQIAEMMGQLKGFGNSLLGKFGLSLDNFKMEKDPNTGSYSVQFNQGGGGGSGGSVGDGESK
jgi:tetratricopeptide (TPR) repeat protein